MNGQVVLGSMGILKYSVFEFRNVVYVFMCVIFSFFRYCLIVCEIEVCYLRSESYS